MYLKTMTERVTFCKHPKANRGRCEPDGKSKSEDHSRVEDRTPSISRLLRFPRVKTGRR